MTGSVSIIFILRIFFQREDYTKTIFRIVFLERTSLLANLKFQVFKSKWTIFPMSTNQDWSETKKINLKIFKLFSIGWLPSCFKLKYRPDKRWVYCLILSRAIVTESLFIWTWSRCVWVYVSAHPSSTSTVCVLLQLPDFKSRLLAYPLIRSIPNFCKRNTAATNNMKNIK